MAEPADGARPIAPCSEVLASDADIPDANIDVGSAVHGLGLGLGLQGEAVGSRPRLTLRHSGTAWTILQ